MDNLQIFEKQILKAEKALEKKDANHKLMLDRLLSYCDKLIDEFNNSIENQAGNGRSRNL